MLVLWDDHVYNTCIQERQLVYLLLSLVQALSDWPAHMITEEQNNGSGLQNGVNKG